MLFLFLSFFWSLHIFLLFFTKESASGGSSARWRLGLQFLFFGLFSLNYLLCCSLHIIIIILIIYFLLLSNLHRVGPFCSSFLLFFPLIFSFLPFRFFILLFFISFLFALRSVFQAKVPTFCICYFLLRNHHFICWLD